MNVATYLRVSSAEQAQGHSLDDQRARLNEWAEREGWSVTDEYEDSGISATDALKRPAFQRMIHDAATGRFERILVKRRDRYARNMADAATYDRLLAGAGVTVWSLEEPGSNDATPAGFLMRGMSDVWAEHYSRELSHKTSQGWRRRALKGLGSSYPPCGYVSAGPRVPPVIVPVEAEAVRTVFVRYAAGNDSMSDLSGFMNQQGFQPRTAKGGRGHFQVSSIDHMLRNAFYAGDIIYLGERVASGLHEPIIERALFERVQVMRTTRNLRPGHARRGPDATYLLSGIAICAGCGGPIWSQMSGADRPNPRRYYRCASRWRGTTCERRGGVRVEAIDGAVGRIMLTMALPDDIQARIFELATAERDGEAAEREAQRLRARITRIQTLLVDGDIEKGFARDELRAARGALAGLDAERGPRVEPMRWALSVPELWPQMSPEGRQAVVRAALTVAVIDPIAGELVGVSPKPELSDLFEAARLHGSLGARRQQPSAGSGLMTARTLYVA